MSEYYDYVVEEDENRIRAIQLMCAAIAERKAWYTPSVIGSDRKALWNDQDVEAIVKVILGSPKPMSLFRFMDERTGSMYVGYRLKDGREWFHILRQIRNSSSLFHEMLTWEKES